LSGHDAHVASAVAPASAEYLPASQSVHSALPVPALNLPAAQSSHAPPSGPVEPALHTHAVPTALPAAAGPDDEPPSLSRALSVSRSLLHD
jgi:hypothetical protein